MAKAVSLWFLTLFRMPLTECRYMAQEPSQGGCLNTPGPARSAPSSGPARVKCTHNGKLVGTIMHVFATPVEILSNVTDVLFLGTSSKSSKQIILSFLTKKSWISLDLTEEIRFDNLQQMLQVQMKQRRKYFFSERRCPVNSLSEKQLICCDLHNLWKNVNKLYLLSDRATMYLLRMFAI